MRAPTNPSWALRKNYRVTVTRDGLVVVQWPSPPPSFGDSRSGEKVFPLSFSPGVIFLLPDDQLVMACLSSNSVADFFCQLGRIRLGWPNEDQSIPIVLPAVSSLKLRNEAIHHHDS